MATGPYNVEARIRGRRSKAKGDAGEMIARRALIDLGYGFIRRIHTPWKIVRGKSGNVLKVFASQSVAGDWRAVQPDTGRSILAEVKYYDRPTLAYSVLEKHQHRSLNEHHAAGGLSLLIWVCKQEPYVLEWPIDGFQPRSSIKIEYAARERLVHGG